MLKKRLIFILYFSNGKFHLSRNFKLQSVGDAQWLFDKFNFQSISQFVDEIVILNVERSKKHGSIYSNKFYEAIQFLMKKTFCPLTVGGGLESINQVIDCFNIGADKVLFNTAAIVCPEVVKDTISKFGSQAVIGSIDYKNDQSTWIKNGYENCTNTSKHIQTLINLNVGEILLNNMDADGTGQGFNFNIFNYIPHDLNMPLIICGGAGKPAHLQSALLRGDVDAVATGNLFNFIGNGFEMARRYLLEVGINVRALSVVKP
jgi:cyclase